MARSSVSHPGIFERGVIAQIPFVREVFTILTIRGLIVRRHPLRTAVGTGSRIQVVKFIAIISLR